MFSYLFKSSRPRFWIYLLGPYIIGASIAYSGDLNALIVNWHFWLWFFYFTFPANFLIYGVNDLADTDTDKFNEKKQSYEVLFDESKTKIYVSLMMFLNLPFLLLTSSLNSLYALLGFWFFGIFYSLKPIRAKAKPFLDSIFNLLYIVPALFAYLSFSFSTDVVSLNYWLILAGIFWSMAMHTFSAIPDIKADKEVNLKTTAVVLGGKGALIYCFSLYVLSGLIPALILDWYFMLFSVPYLGLMSYCYFKFEPDSDNLFKVYKFFPVLNSGIGFILFWLVTGKLYFGF